MHIRIRVDPRSVGRNAHALARPLRTPVAADSTITQLRLQVQLSAGLVRDLYSTIGFSYFACFENWRDR